MAVLLDNVKESHTGTTGSASEASFTFSYTVGAAGGIQGILVFTFVNANADDALGVTYDGIALTAVPGGRAVDTATEPGDCKAWFLGSGIPAGTPKNVVVTRNNNANVMYAVAVGVTALTDTEVTGVVLQQENQAPAEANVDDGSPGTNSQRFAGANYGGSAPPVAGTHSNSVAGYSIDFGTRTAGVCTELTPGQGSRPVGFSDASDDWACVLLAVREVVAPNLDSLTRPFGVRGSQQMQQLLAI